MKYTAQMFLSIGTLFITLPTLTLGEKVPFSLLRRLLPDAPIVVEAGAQLGEDTAWMSEFWPQGKIYSFEPNPPSYAKLCEVAQKCKNVFTEQLALSDTVGEFSFYLAGGASSLLRPDQQINNVYFHSDLNHPITVKATTLDLWAQSKSITNIDFLWFDMEGNELRAFKGAPAMLKTVKVIYTEVNLQRFWEGCVLYSELTNWLNKQGFEKVWDDIVPNWHGNAVFVNKNL